MYLADCHVHSRVSADASHSMTEMAAAGLAAGLNELCFTEHVEPVNLWDPQWPPYDRFPWRKLEEEFASVQAAYGDRMTLRMGVELGDAFVDYARTEAILAEAPPLDFIIGSVHILPEQYGHHGSASFRPKDEAEARQSMADYLDLVQKMADWGQFSVLGHLTVPQRYLTERFGFDLTFDGFEAEIESIFRTLIRNGCGIEVNTNRGHVPLPDAKWLRLYRSLGGEIVTLGSDAHVPEHVACAVGARQELLKECGFSRFCTFETLQPVWHAL